MRSLFEHTARDPRFIGRASPKSGLLLAAMVLPVVLLLAMLALTPLGHWQMDELMMMNAYRHNGLSALLARIVTWSPRPLSESILYAYSLVTQATGRQLTGTFLLVLWSLLIAACLLPAALIRTGDSGGRRVAMLVALTILALLVSGHPVSEVFYWTQAAGAYIPTIAFIIAPFACLIFSFTRRGWIDAVIALGISLAALSSEVGAFFSVFWGAGAPLLLWIGRRLAGERSIVRRRDALFLAPLLSGLGVVYLLANARFGSPAEIFDPAIARQLGASIWTTLTVFPSDVLAVDLGAVTPEGFLLGIVSKLALFALCVFAFARTAGRASLDLRLLVAAFGIVAFASALFSLFAAYYQFGANCCQRHQTIRSQFIVIAVLALGWLVAQHPRASALSRRSAAWMAGAAVVATASSAAFLPAAMDHDFAHYRRILEARGANWSDGMSADQTMTLRLSHRGEVMGGIYAPAGIFDDEEKAPRQIQSLMNYFHKTKVVAE